MDSSEIVEKEFKVMEQVSRDKNLTQRKISQRLGLSLGMTNLIIRKLANKGYIKIKGLNRRNVQYILTPQGFAEKTKKSCRYLLRIIDSLKTMKEKIQQLILMEYGKGETHFIILGDGELADIVELSFKDLDNKLEYRRVSRAEEINTNKAVILLTQSEPELRKSDLGLRTSDLDVESWTSDIEPRISNPKLRSNKCIDVLSTLSGGN